MWSVLAVLGWVKPFIKDFTILRLSCSGLFQVNHASIMLPSATFLIHRISKAVLCHDKLLTTDNLCTVMNWYEHPCRFVVLTQDYNQTIVLTVKNQLDNVHFRACSIHNRLRISALSWECALPREAYFTLSYALWLVQNGGFPWRGSTYSFMKSVYCGGST